MLHIYFVCDLLQYMFKPKCQEKQFYWRGNTRFSIEGNSQGTTTATKTDEKLGKTYFGCDKTHITISD